MNLLISPAYAQSAPTAGGFDFMSLLPLVLIFVVFYFFLIRPQQKKAQEQRSVLAALKRGDKIVTNGGLIGVITKVVSDQEIQVEIAENVRVRVARAMVGNVISGSDILPSEDVSTAAERPAKSRPAIKKPAARAKKKA
jgi:preprotein translocase subunit YajC